ncbi:50S ribosomal protein L24 [Candidatus Pacearchaeota archaeon]|nr:50S ribosomal protein L24 [Candidatus Pacearchaeota archaeon]
MAKCSFCSKNILQGKGKTLIEESGRIHNLCSNKCYKSWKMKRDPKKLEWARVKARKVE